ncbi:hypothetical protein VNI00_009280 [Paramarasmius palmivorus]|uniref:Sulfatase N-terminal domain-containing protein n=1 Tax=Paramarasmius palmivorus TaxID=297713 RepID=A0AAW0CSH9_9AGAR
MTALSFLSIAALFFKYLVLVHGQGDGQFLVSTSIGSTTHTGSTVSTSTGIGASSTTRIGGTSTSTSIAIGISTSIGASSTTHVGGTSTSTSTGIGTIATTGTGTATATTSSTPSQTARPNIILIITDDQDVRTGTMDYMPKTQKAIAEQGTSYERFYAPVSLCCPSRVSLLRAQYAHNHNITYVGGPYGGYHLFCEKGQNDAYLPVFLQEAGYNTYYTGKLMNGLNWDLIHSEYPKGWTYSDFLVDPNAYLYFNASFSANNTNSAPVSFQGQYQVDVIKQKALGLLQDAVADSGKPFFLGIAPTAPHMELPFDGGFTEPLPRNNETTLFEDVKVPRSPSFNVKGQGAVSWLKDLQELNQTVVDYIDHVHRQRLRVLQPVDDLVEAIVQAVENAGPNVADNTYIIYTSDNGYALGSHQRNPGKTLPYEEGTQFLFLNLNITQ